MSFYENVFNLHKRDSIMGLALPSTGDEKMQRGPHNKFNKNTSSDLKPIYVKLTDMKNEGKK